MSVDRKKQLGKDLVTTAVNAAATAGGVLATAGSLEHAIVRGGFSLGAGLLNAVRSFFGKQNQKLLTGYSPDESEQEAADRLEDAASRNPDNVQTIVGILKNVEDTIDPDVLPILGKLLRSYTDEDRPFDGFARGFSRFLRDLDRGDVEELQDCWLRLGPIVKDLRIDPAGFRVLRLLVDNREPEIVKVSGYNTAMHFGDAASIRLWFDVIDKIAPFLL